jgi:branched-chain amino acid transport system permease protein
MRTMLRPAAVDVAEPDVVRVRPPAYAGHQYRSVVVFVAAVALLVPRLMTSRAAEFSANLWLVYAIAGIGFYWMVGLAGRAAFCQTFMMAFGGYTSAWVTRTWGEAWFLVGLLAAMAVTWALAVVVGVLVRKAQFFFFAIATMAVTQVGLEVFRKADSFTGPNGTQSGISAPHLFGKELLANDEIFWVFLAALALVLLAGAALERSPIRRDAVACRDNVLVARASGIAATKVQVLFFAAGSALGGLSGALIGHWNGVIGVDSFGFDLAVGIFLMLYLGGTGSMWGPVLGAAFYVEVPRLLSSFAKYQLIVYGLVLLVVVLGMPDGLIGGAQRVVAAARKRVTRARG